MATTTKKPQPWKDEGLKKPEWVAREVAKAVNAGKAWDLETVDFSDPNRPLTCLEVDFPIIPINQIAAIEGNAGKPIYQMSKWWARRRSSVFRSMLLAAAIKCPDDPAEAAKLVWDVYYGNHQTKGTFKDLKVADIFMGGGTTVVEGSRLGMQMYGNDLNPVAWFVVKNELAQVDKAEVEKLLADIEAEVKPQIMPFYACDCPRGHKGKWTQISTDTVMGDDFDPLALTPDERKDYRYEGPEIIYTFWAKHGPCQVTGCGHRTPIMSNPVMAVKSISIKAWERTCKHCNEKYDLEEREARMAPGVELVVADTEKPYAIAKLNMVGLPESANCPHCGKEERFGQLAKAGKKKIELSLLVHPDWLKGESSQDDQCKPYGGSADDPVDATVRWNNARATTCKLVEVRGELPEEVETIDGTRIKTGKEGGTVPGNSRFTCQADTCGTSQVILKSLQYHNINAPVAMYAYHGYCPDCDDAKETYNGRFFAPMHECSAINSAHLEWNSRCDDDLEAYWPRQEIPFGDRTHIKDPLPKHGFNKWSDLFNPRQKLVLSLLLKAIDKVCDYGSPDACDMILGAFQQYIRNQNMFCFWDIGYDKLVPFMSNNNYNPKNNFVENGVYSDLGRGNWRTQYGNLENALDWLASPTECVHKSQLANHDRQVADAMTGKSEKAFCGDPLVYSESLACLSASEHLTCGTSTELKKIADNSYDAVITDPPFGGILQYAELADFFYVWLRLALKDRYPDFFGAEHTPKSLEAVANTARHPGTATAGELKPADAFYQRLLTECWREAGRILKPGGVLAFTFHHNEDTAWVSVLESLFDAGFALVATYPIRGDESKGENAQFGSQKIEYDIIHVCRMRTQATKPVSWAKLRKQVLHDVRELQVLLEHHQEEGLPEADLQVIRRGKALEYFSRHYGQVFKGPETPMSVLEALLGINQLLEEEAGGIKEPPPHNAEPFTRMLLRLFDGVAELPRDQMQKFLRGTGSAPSNFENRGWVTETKKVFYLVSPLELAQAWAGKQRRGMTSDYDQAMFLIGACFENSGINATETLNNANFRPHPALGGILTWFKTHGADSPTRNAAITASQLYKAWEAKNQPKAKELTLFDMLGENE